MKTSSSKSTITPSPAGSARIMSRTQALLYQPLSKLITTESRASFTCFAKLPLELRAKIWSYACKHPRTIKLCITSNRYDFQAIRGCCRPPAILHACSESRQEGLKHYELFRQGRVPCSQLLDDNIRTKRCCLYVNFDFDHFRISPDSYLGESGPLMDLIQFYHRRPQPAYKFTYPSEMLRKIRFLELEVQVLTRGVKGHAIKVNVLWTKFGISRKLERLNLVLTESESQRINRVRRGRKLSNVRAEELRQDILRETVEMLRKISSQAGSDIDKLEAVAKWDMPVEAEFDPAHVER